MEKNGIPIGSVKDTKPKSEGTKLKGYWAEILDPEEIDAPDRIRGYVDYSKPSNETRSPIDITKKDEIYIRLAVEKYLQENKKSYPTSLMFLPDGTEINYDDFSQNISQKGGVWYLRNPATNKEERLKDTWVEKNKDFLSNATADRFFNLKKQAVQSAIDAVWGKLMFRHIRKYNAFVKDLNKPKPVIITSKYPKIQAVLDSVKDDVVKVQGRFMTKHAVLQEYMKDEAISKQNEKRFGKATSSPQYYVAKDYYNFTGFDWDGLYNEMMKK